MADKTETASASTGTDEGRSVAEHSLGPLWTLRDDIDDMFEDVFSNAGFGRLRRGRHGRRRHRGAGRQGWAMPTLDVIDRQDAVTVCAELPGMTQDDIDVHVTDDTLVLSGEKKEEHEQGDKQGERYLAERRYGSFSRTIAIPEGIDHQRIEARFKNGVLTVTLPKKPEAQKPVRKIKVEPEA